MEGNFFDFLNEVFPSILLMWAFHISVESAFFIDSFERTFFSKDIKFFETW